MGKGGAVADRVPVSIPAEARALSKRPEALGLPRGSSQSKVYNELLRRAAVQVTQDERSKRRRAIYAEYEKDPERQAAITILASEALQALQS